MKNSASIGTKIGVAPDPRMPFVAASKKWPIVWISRICSVANVFQDLIRGTIRGFPQSYRLSRPMPVVLSYVLSNPQSLVYTEVCFTQRTENERGKYFLYVLEKLILESSGLTSN